MEKMTNNRSAAASKMKEKNIMIIQIFIHRDNRGRIESIDWLEIKSISGPLHINQLLAFEDAITENHETFFCENDLKRAMVATVEVCFDEDGCEYDAYCERVISIDEDYPECYFLQEIKHPDSVCNFSVDNELPF